MKQRQLGRTGLHVGEIALGTMMFGEKTTAPEATAIIHRALDAGANLIDTADVYAQGASEEIVGRALQGRRNQAVLATKGGRTSATTRDLSRRYLVQAVEASLRRLQTDWIDLYQVHHPDTETPLEETLGALTDLVRQGKIRWIGCSNFPASLLSESLEISAGSGLARFDTIQPRYNLFVREPEAELFPLCLQHEIGVLAYSPLGGGILTGKYLDGAPDGSRGWQNPGWQEARLTPEAVAAARSVRRAARELGRPAGEVAIRWVLGHRAVTCALVGPRTMAQWEEALSASAWELPPVQYRLLDPSQPR